MTGSRSTHSPSTHAPFARRPNILKPLAASADFTTVGLRADDNSFVSDERGMLKQREAETIAGTCGQLFASARVPLWIVVTDSLGEPAEHTAELVRAEFGLSASTKLKTVRGLAARSRVLADRATHFAHACLAARGLGDRDWSSGIVILIAKLSSFGSDVLVVDAALGAAWADADGNSLLARNIVRHVLRSDVAAAAQADTAHISGKGAAPMSTSRRIKNVAIAALRGLNVALISRMTTDLATVICPHPESILARVDASHASTTSEDTASTTAPPRNGGLPMPCPCHNCEDARRGWSRLPPPPIQGTYYQFVTDGALALSLETQCGIERISRFLYAFTRAPLAVVTVRALVNVKPAKLASTAAAMAVETFNAWGLGFENWNVGALLFIVASPNPAEAVVAAAYGADVSADLARAIDESVRALNSVLRAADLSGVLEGKELDAQRSGGRAELEPTHLAMLGAETLKQVRELARLMGESLASPPRSLHAEPRGSLECMVYLSPYSSGTAAPALTPLIGDTLAVGSSGRRRKSVSRSRSRSCEGSSTDDFDRTTGTTGSMVTGTVTGTATGSTTDDESMV